NRQGHFYTIQVKKAGYNPRKCKRYLCITVVRSSNINQNIKVPYRDGEADFFFGCLIATEDCWIMPFSFVKRFKKHISLDSKSAELAAFKNNWNPLLAI